MEKTWNQILEELTPKEREALKEAVTVLYLNDSSDYMNGLWGVVRALVGNQMEEESFDLRKVMCVLDPEMEN